MPPPFWYYENGKSFSLRRETPVAHTPTASPTYFNPLSPRGERRLCTGSAETAYDISTHSLLAERDHAQKLSHMPDGISTHSLLAERDPCFNRRSKASQSFQPTLSSRRETGLPSAGISGEAISTHSLLAERDSFRIHTHATACHFNPLSPRGERPGSVLIIAHLKRISTHSLLAERDTPARRCMRWPIHFNPLSPRGERLPRHGKFFASIRISTHSLLAERDIIAGWRTSAARYFNPLSPRGERPFSRFRPADQRNDFNPLSPRGERLGELERVEKALEFQPTLSSRRETSAVRRERSSSPNFNPLSPRGERLERICPSIKPSLFQPTLSSRRETVMINKTSCSFFIILYKIAYKPKHRSTDTPASNNRFAPKWLFDRCEPPALFTFAEGSHRKTTRYL